LINTSKLIIHAFNILRKKNRTLDREKVQQKAINIVNSYVYKDNTQNN